MGHPRRESKAVARVLPAPGQWRTETRCGEVLPENGAAARPRRECEVVVVATRRGSGIGGLFGVDHDRLRHRGFAVRGHDLDRAFDRLDERGRRRVAVGDE